MRVLQSIGSKRPNEEENKMKPEKRNGVIIMSKEDRI
jgi:hypothetical protein